MEICKIILEKIKDENIKVCTTNNDNKLFLKSGKVLLIARNVFLELCEKTYDEFWELIKDYDKISVMNENNDCTVISINENLNSSYYVPMEYEDGEITGKISFTEKLAKKNDLEYNIGKFMRSSFIRNNRGEEYFGLFNSVKSLRRVFSEKEYNVLAIDFDDILTFCDDKDIIIAPTICDLRIPQKMIRNVKSIEFVYYTNIYSQIRRMDDLDFGSEEGFVAYTSVLQQLREFEHLFIITNDFDYPDLEAKPLVRKVELGNVVNVFTDFGLALKWCEHYNYKIDGIMPIGVLEKKNNYLSLFQTAKHFNIGIMLNDGFTSVIFSPGDFVRVNNLDDKIDVVFKPEELESVMKGGIPQIDFNKYKIALPKKND